jgi:hypothetical protein
MRIKGWLLQKGHRSDALNKVRNDKVWRLPRPMALLLF